MTYAMTCTCGHKMTVDADSRDEAVSKMQDMMDDAAIKAHWEEFHADDAMPMPSIEQSHAMIASNLVEEVTDGGDMPASDANGAM